MLSSRKIEFYLATSYKERARAVSIASKLIDKVEKFIPIFPWWLIDADDTVHNSYQEKLAELELNGAAKAEVFIFMHPARKGTWAELGAACYDSLLGSNKKIFMVVPEDMSPDKEYYPPFCRLPCVEWVVYPKGTPEQEEEVIVNTLASKIYNHRQHDDVTANMWHKWE
jgi:hypothetical protein